MKSSVCVVVLLVVVSCVVAQPPYHGPTWNQKSSSTKQQLLWQVITANQTAGPWPSSLELGEIFLENMAPTFDSVQDDLPTEGSFLFNRKKLIHSVGCTALGSFKTLDTQNYTGIFTGASNVVIRFSTARQYDSTEYSFTPAAAFKFLRSGVPSGDVIAMYSLEGQSSFNFFKHDLTNHVPDLSLNASYALEALRVKFESVSSYVSMLGLSELATYDQNGKYVANPRFPFRLVFQPVKALKTFFPDDYGSDDLCDTLENTPLGTIYNVYAEDTPGNTPTMIGNIVLSAAPVRSYWGDTTLFFEHQRMEDDFQYYPQWVAEADAILEKEQNSYYFNGYADLPDPSM